MIDKIGAAMYKGIRAIDAWFSYNSFFAKEQQEQLAYDNWRKYYEQFTDRELSSRYVNLTRKLEWNRRVSCPLAVIFCSAAVIGGVSTMFGFLKKILLDIYPYGGTAWCASLGCTVDEMLQAWFMGLGLLIMFGFMIFPMIFSRTKSSFHYLQTRLLVIEEIRADRRRNEVRGNEH